MDLYQMVVIDRRDGWTYPQPFPNGKGASCCRDEFGFSPVGETGEGFE